VKKGHPWLCSYGSWVYNYLYNHCELESRSWWGVLDTTLCDKSLSVTWSRLVVFIKILSYLLPNITIPPVVLLIQQWSPCAHTPVINTYIFEKWWTKLFPKDLILLMNITSKITNVETNIICTTNSKFAHLLVVKKGHPWLCSYGSWVYNYLYNHCELESRSWCTSDIIIINKLTLIQKIIRNLIIFPFNLNKWYC
jgi:hypothetical protein